MSRAGSVIGLLLVVHVCSAMTVWNPQDPGSLMSEHVYNNDGVHRRVTWAEHAGFTMQLDAAGVYDNWSAADNAPQVRIDLDADPIHLRDHDFTIQVQTTLQAGYGTRFHAGLCVVFGPNDLLVFGPHGTTDLRLRRPGPIDYWQTYPSTTAYLKLKRRGDQYAAWYSQDGQIWSLLTTVTISQAPLYVGTILKNWTVPRAETVTFRYFELTHVENEPESYALNTKYTGVSGQGIHFIYDLSGIDVLMHVYLRQTDGTPVDYADRKLYYIHASAAPGQPYDPAPDINALISQNLLHPTDSTGRMNLLLVAPVYFDGKHPYFSYDFGYRWLDGEEDWMLIDIHENFIRERFPASQASLDDKFYVMGSSAGGQFVNRFAVGHARKLHRAVMRAAGGVTFPTDTILWCNGLNTAVFAAERNPRLQPNLADLAALQLASLVGENDNEIYAPIILPWVYSSHDTARKWPRMVAAASGGSNTPVYIRSREGHGFGYYGRQLALQYLFGNATDLNEIARWQYNYELGPQDQTLPVAPADIPRAVFYYTRFERWVLPQAWRDGTYQFFPNGTCKVFDRSGVLVEEIPYQLTRTSTSIRLDVRGDSYVTPEIRYGALSLKNATGSAFLQQLPIMTRLFIDERVVSRDFYVYQGNDRTATGPSAARYGPRFRLTGDGAVVDSDTGLPYGNPTMRQWSFDETSSILSFANEAGQPASWPRIGEWRWGMRANEPSFVAGLHTLDVHDSPRREIQTDLSYNNRYFEEWDMGPHTWAGLNVPGDFDRDGDVDQSDFGHLQTCLTGPATPQANFTCQDARLDDDTDVDVEDIQVFLSRITGPSLPG